MKLDAFMKIKLDPPEASAFASSGDKDNADKVEIMSFRQTVVRATDFKGAAKEDAPKSIVFTVYRMVDADSARFFKCVDNDKQIELSIFVRMMHFPDPAPTPAVPKYDRDYITIVVAKAKVTRVRIALQSKPDGFGIYEEVDFTCKADKIDWKTGKSTSTVTF